MLSTEAAWGDLRLVAERLCEQADACIDSCSGSDAAPPHGPREESSSSHQGEQSEWGSDWTSASGSYWPTWPASKKPSCSTPPGTKACPAPNASSPTPTPPRNASTTSSGWTPTPPNGDMGNTPTHPTNHPSPTRLPPKDSLARKVPLARGSDSSPRAGPRWPKMATRRLQG